MVTGVDNSGKKVFIAGAKVKLNEAPLFRTESYPTSHRSLTGVFYLYDGKCVNGRYKVVESRASVKFKPESMVFVGWIAESDLGILP